MIKSDYLLDKEANIQDDYYDLLAEWENVRDIINSVSDITSASAPTFYDVNVSKNAVVDTLTELEEDLATFTRNGKEEISEIESVLDNIDRTLKDAGAVSGSKRFVNYTGNSVTLGLPVLQAYNEGIQDEMIAKAEKAKDAAIKDMDPSTQDVLNRLFNQLKNGEIDEEEYYAHLNDLKTLQNRKNLDLENVSMYDIEILKNKIIEDMEDDELKSTLNNAYTDFVNGKIDRVEFHEIAYTLQKAEKDVELGEIDQVVYDEIKGILVNSGFTSTFTQNSIQKIVSDKVSEKMATEIYNWFNTTSIINNPVMEAVPVAEPEHGSSQTVSKPPSKLTNTVRNGLRTGAKLGGPVIGTVFDYSIQTATGEDTTDAAVKAVGHLGAGLTGSAIGSAVPFIGTAGGFIIGVVGSIGFDWIYDNKTEMAQGVEDFTNELAVSVENFIGEQLSWFALGSVFD